METVRTPCPALRGGEVFFWGAVIPGLHSQSLAYPGLSYVSPLGKLRFGVVNGVSDYEKPREGTITLLRKHSEGEKPLREAK